MQHRLYRTLGIIVFVLACLAVLGCGSQPDTPATSTFTIQVSIAPQSNGIFPADWLDYPDGGVSPLSDADKPTVTRVQTDSIELELPHMYVVGDDSTASSDASTGYRIKSFAVEEDVDGERVRFSEFTTRTQYVTDIGVVILVDNSDSLSGRLSQNRDLARQLGRALLGDSRTQGSMAVAVMPVNLAPGQAITFTNNLAEVARQAGRIRTHAYTPLYEALKAAVRLFDDYERTVLRRNDLREEQFKFEEQFIVLITDGQDNSSATQTNDTILQELIARDDPIKVWILAVKGRDNIREGALRRLIGDDVTDQTPTPSDRYIDLSVLSPDKAKEQMVTVKDAIITSCRDMYHLNYHRSAIIPVGGIEATFIITAEQKMPPASEAGGILRNVP